MINSTKEIKGTKEDKQFLHKVDCEEFGTLK